MKLTAVVALNLDREMTLQGVRNCELSRRTGIDEIKICKLRHGNQNLSIYEVYLIAAVMGITCDSLLLNQG